MNSVLPFNPQSTGPVLPLPGKKRWQPLRTGVVEIFFYDVEEFWFIDGHIVYRGNNGAGKSKLLALTLPFLFDADLSPFRVEPDGDRPRRWRGISSWGGTTPRRICLGRVRARRRGRQQPVRHPRVRTGSDRRPRERGKLVLHHRWKPCRSGLLIHHARKSRASPNAAER